MRRGTPEVLVATLILLLLGSYVWYTHSIATRLRADAKRSTEMYARVYRPFETSPSGSGDLALLELSQSITEQGVPLILVNAEGEIAGHANLPFDKPAPVQDDDPRVRAYIPTLAAQNAPVVDSVIGKIYFGDPPIVQSLSVIPVLQALFAAVVLLALQLRDISFALIGHLPQYIGDTSVVGRPGETTTLLHARPHFRNDLLAHDRRIRETPRRSPRARTSRLRQHLPVRGRSAKRPHLRRKQTLATWLNERPLTDAGVGARDD